MIADISTRDMLAFTTLARLGSYTLASSTLGMTQSSLSKKIKELEARLEVRLFDRTTRMVQITPEGAEFLQHAQRFLDQMERSLEDVRRRAAGTRGRLAIASGPHMSGNMLPPIISAFARRHPEVEVVVYDSQTANALRALLSEEAEIGVTVRPVDWIEHPQLDYIRIADVELPLQAVLHNMHPLTAQPSVRWADLKAHKVILLRHSAAAARLVEAVLTQQRVDFDDIFEVSLVDTALGLAASEHGIAVLPGYVRSRHRADFLVYRPILGTSTRFQISVQYLRGRSLSGPARRFAEELRAHHLGDSSDLVCARNML